MVISWHTRSMHLFGYASLLLLPGCGSYRTELLVHKISSPYDDLVNRSRILAARNTKQNRPIITVWIHGTRFFSATVFKELFKRKPALKPYHVIDTSHDLGKAVHALHHTYYATHQLGHMYFFGWSGKLSFAARETAALQLRNDLEALIQQFRSQHGQTPVLRIIAHSHGGNVALSLAHIIETHPVSWQIDELILLACPVQGKTMHYVHSELFTRIYSLYSSIDIVQLLDPQWLFDRHNASAFFSKRDFPLNRKLTQVRIALNGCALMHTDFSGTRILRVLPTIINEINTWSQQLPPALAPWWQPAKKLLSIYTNGRSINPDRYAYRNAKKLRRLAQRVPLTSLDIH